MEQNFIDAQKMQLLLGKLDKKILNGLKMTALFLDLEDYILDFKDDNFKKIESGIFATCKKWDNYNFDLAA